MTENLKKGTHRFEPIDNRRNRLRGTEITIEIDTTLHWFGPIRATKYLPRRPTIGAAVAAANLPSNNPNPAPEISMTGVVDPPGPFAPLKEREVFLEEMRAWLDPGDPIYEAALREAEEMIAKKAATRHSPLSAIDWGRDG